MSPRWHRKGCHQQAGQGHLSCLKGVSKSGAICRSWTQALRCLRGGQHVWAAGGFTLPGRLTQAERHAPPPRAPVNEDSRESLDSGDGSFLWLVRVSGPPNYGLGVKNGPSPCGQLQCKKKSDTSQGQSRLNRKGREVAKCSLWRCSRPSSHAPDSVLVTCWGACAPPPSVLSSSGHRAGN